MQKKLLIDVDGTIMDPSLRYHALYMTGISYVKKLAKTERNRVKLRILSLDEFISLKREGIPNKDILDISQIPENYQPLIFGHVKLTERLPDLLRFDRLLPKVKNAFEILKNLDFEMGIVSLRDTQSIKCLVEQYDLPINKELVFGSHSSDLWANPFDAKTGIIEKAILGGYLIRSQLSNTYSLPSVELDIKQRNIDESNGAAKWQKV